MKPGPIIGLTIIALALGFGAYAFKGSLIAYVPFSQAVAAGDSGSDVQIIGRPVKQLTSYNLASGTLNFTLQEPATGTELPIAFKSPKPDNFDEAVQITAIGKYDPETKTFEADNLLVKCPSKYAGQDPNQRSYTGG